FRMTQLDDNASFFGPGASLSREHFEAFFKANPLRSYEILEVVRLEQRTIEAPTEKGSARFEVEAKLHYEDDSVVRQHYSIVGEVVPTVEVEPTLVSVRDARGAPDRDVVLVDGVQTKVVTRDDAPFANVFTLLVLPGRHRVSVAGRELEIRTEPLRVLSGSATVADGPGGGKILEIV
ncbi:MAG TPA: hypothetical protein VM600_03865, partial [Actinomycetota bacterium]|nr:hypothetical protein [Actinomycetota bacterium]